MSTREYAAGVGILIIFILAGFFIFYMSAQPSSQDKSQKIYDSCVARYTAQSDALRYQYRAEIAQTGVTILPSQGYDDSAITVMLPIESFLRNVGQENMTTVYQKDFDHGSRFFALSITTPNTIYVLNAYVETDYVECSNESGQPLPDMGMCVIATAAYGSAMAPEVVYMRHVRDDLIGSTPIGHRLVQGFNAFYYSWSPPVAKAIAGSEALRAVFRVLLTPLSAIVHTAGWSFAFLGAGELASVIAFTLAAMLSVGAYVLLPVSPALILLWRKRSAGAELEEAKP